MFRTDEGNFILDVEVDRIEDPSIIEAQLNGIPGVVENGLFVNRTSIVILGGTDGITIKERPVF